MPHSLLPTCPLLALSVPVEPLRGHILVLAPCFAPSFASVHGSVTASATSVFL
jgi:hypothetical protein